MWAASRKKGPYGIFDQNFYFSIFWMYIILRLVHEYLSSVAVKISFLWGRKHGKNAAASFSASVIQNFTSVILYTVIQIVFRSYRTHVLKHLKVIGHFVLKFWKV